MSIYFTTGKSPYPKYQPPPQKKSKEASPEPGSAKFQYLKRTSISNIKLAKIHKAHSQYHYYNLASRAIPGDTSLLSTNRSLHGKVRHGDRAVRDATSLSAQQQDIAQFGAGEGVPLNNKGCRELPYELVFSVEQSQIGKEEATFRCLQSTGNEKGGEIIRMQDIVGQKSHSPRACHQLPVLNAAGTLSDQREKQVVKQKPVSSNREGVVVTKDAAGTDKSGLVA